MRQQKRFINIGKKEYKDTVSGWIVWEMFSATDFGYAVWGASPTEQNTAEFRGKFSECKKYLEEKFPDAVEVDNDQDPGGCHGNYE